MLRGNQWQSSAVLKHCDQGQSGAIKRRTQALCSGAIRGNQAPYSSTVLGGNQWQSVAIRAPSHLRAIDAHTREISLDEIGRVARARPTAVWQAIEIVRDEMMAAHRERPVAREQQRAREAGFVTERHPTALELVTGLLRAHVPAQGAIRRNQGTLRAQSVRNQRAIRRTQTQSSAQSSGRGSGVDQSPGGDRGEGGRGGSRGKGGTGGGWGGGGGVRERGNQLPKGLFGYRPLPHAQPRARPTVRITFMRTSPVPRHVGGVRADLCGDEGRHQSHSRPRSSVIKGQSRSIKRQSAYQGHL